MSTVTVDTGNMFKKNLLINESRAQEIVAALSWQQDSTGETPSAHAKQPGRVTSDQVSALEKLGITWSSHTADNASEITVTGEDNIEKLQAAVASVGSEPTSKTQEVGYCDKVNEPPAASMAL